MNSQPRTLTIGLSFDEIAKKVMARIALIIANQSEDKPFPLLFNNCRLNELIFLKAKEECDKVCSIFAGYITEYTSDEHTATILMTLPPHYAKINTLLIASQFEEAVTESVTAAIFSSSHFLTTELNECKIARQHAISALRQVLAPH